MTFINTIEDQVKDIKKANIDAYKMRLSNLYNIRRSQIQNRILEVESNIEARRTVFATAIADPSVSFNLQEKFDQTAGDFNRIKQFEDELEALDKAYQAFEI